MKRPLACVGFGALAAASAAALGHIEPAVEAAVCASFAAVLFCLRLCFGKKTVPAAVFMLSAAVCASAFFCADLLIRKPILDKFDGQTVCFSGVITDTPYTYGTTTFFTVKTISINGSPARLNIKISSDSAAQGSVFDKVTGKCTLTSIVYDDDYIDYTSYYNARHIFLEAYVSKYDDSLFEYIENTSFTPIKHLYALRDKIVRSLFSLLSYDEASLCSAVLTGQRQFIDSDIKRQFRGLGIMHLLVVSGMHLAVTAGIVFTITDIFIKNKYESCAVRFAAVLTFALMTGFGYSVRRALVVFLVAMLSEIFDSSADPLNTLGLAAIILYADPYAGGDVGLLWSFAAAASQILLGTRIYSEMCSALKIKGGAAKAFVSLFSSSAAGVMGSLPFVLTLVKVVSPYTIAANVLILPVTGVMMVGAALGGAAAAAGLSWAAVLPALAAGLCARWALAVSAWLSEMPFAFEFVRDPFYFYCVSIFIAGVSCVYIFTHKASYTRRSAAALTAVLLGAIAAKTAYSANTAELTITNLADGISAVITTPESCAVISCAGSPKNYGRLKSSLSQYEFPAFLIDISPFGYKNDYGRRLSYEFMPDVVFVSDDKIRRKYYSWYEYCGGSVEVVGDRSGYELGSSCVDVFQYDDAVCKLITYSGCTVLLCEGSGESVPIGRFNPDIAVTSSDSAQWDFGSDTRIVDISGENSCVTIKFREDGLTYDVQRY